MLWVWHVAPEWMQEWHSTVSAYSSNSVNDPGLVSSYVHDGAMVISLQAVASAF